MLELNKTHLLDCLEGIPMLDDLSIDLVVTSPPYFNSGHKYQRGTGFHYTADIGEPLYFIYDCLELLKTKLKADGIICLNLGFSYAETGAMRPFDIVNRARQKIGYFVNDVIIWHKPNPVPMQGRLTNAFEYIFVMSKHPIGKYYTTEYTHNVWDMPIATSGTEHSARYPEQLSDNCIKTFTKEGDLVCDPFMGSGTTGLSAIKLKRNFIGFEINPDYVKIAEGRLRDYMRQMKIIDDEIEAQGWADTEG